MVATCILQLLWTHLLPFLRLQTLFWSVWSVFFLFLLYVMLLSFLEPLHLIFPLQCSFFPFLTASATSHLSSVSSNVIISESFFANINVEHLLLDFPHIIMLTVIRIWLLYWLSFWKSCVYVCVFVPPLNLKIRMTKFLSFLFPNLSSVLQMDNFWYITGVWEIYFQFNMITACSQIDQ